MKNWLRYIFPLLITFVLISTSPAVDLVQSGKPVATIVVEEPPPDPNAKPAKGKSARRSPNSLDDTAAAELLAAWVKKITDADLPITDTAPKSGPVIYIGTAAKKAGLKLDDIASPSNEGLRILVDGDKLLIAGQSGPATVKAVARFLEELGCRYFMDGPLGEVYPRSKDLSVKALSLTEKPALLYRNPKGPSWSAVMWKTWNGAGGESFSHSHSWGQYIPKGAFEQHPEYFALRDGERRNGDWLCTSNPGARQMFAENVITKIKAGSTNPSISPPDGRGYCQCEKCVAQDDPNVIEPSSGNIAVSNRYADFFDAVGKIVAKECPEAILSFYCYADYTQAPTFDRKLSPNLCAVIAPIRYCRLHSLGDPNCPTRKQMTEMVDGWGQRASHLGYYNYMYNLADTTLPFFKYKPCEVEFPALADRGLAFMTIEVVSNWYVYGPQMYLSLRLAYDPKADPAAIMEDYFTKFYGPAAAPMKAYWTGIDQAVAKMQCHTGGWYGLNQAYTPEFVRECQANLQKAADVAGKDEVIRERVAMAASGMQNVIDYQAICEAMGRGDFPGAKRLYDGMLDRIGVVIQKKQANPEYGTAYLKRFLGKTLDGVLAVAAPPNKVVATLPDQWKFHADPKEEGVTRGYAAADFDDAKWQKVPTHSSTLSAQGIDSNTVLWYRTKFDAPASAGPLALVFAEVDGTVQIWVNGKEIEPKPAVAPPASKKPASGPPKLPRRQPFVVDLSGVVKPGENVVAVKADNRTITELFLGGIIRPVLLVERQGQ